MSQENVKAHIARLTTDHDYRRRINEIADVDERMAFQREEGFDFEGEEVQPALAEIPQEELEAAGGGACRTGDVAACGSPWNHKTLVCSAVNGGGENCCR